MMGYVVLVLTLWAGAVRPLALARPDVDHAGYHDNEISQDQAEEAASAPPCLAAELPRWDRLFVALEDSHMRQNMLLDALQGCCGDAASASARLEQLVQGACQGSPSSSPEPACPGQAGESSSRLLQSLLEELRQQGAASDRRMNAALQQLLQAGRALSARQETQEVDYARSQEPEAGTGTGRKGESRGQGLTSESSRT